jgi:hypothetical protein
VIVILILLALFAAAAAAPWLGRDSGALDDGAWSRDALWSRDQAAPG